MQKTNKELAEFYGIQVGNKINVFNDDGSIYGIFLVRDLEATCPLQVIHCSREPQLCAAGVSHIGTRRYEVIKPKKKYGDLKCKDFINCSDGCPLRSMSCVVGGDHTLYKTLDLRFAQYNYTDGTDNPIYKAYKAELDKEVEE